MCALATSASEHGLVVVGCNCLAFVFIATSIKSSLFGLTHPLSPNVLHKAPFLPPYTEALPNSLFEILWSPQPPEQPSSSALLLV